MPAGTSVATLSGQWPAESTHHDLIVGDHPDPHAKRVYSGADVKRCSRGAILLRTGTRASAR